MLAASAGRRPAGRLVRRPGRRHTRRLQLPFFLLVQILLSIVVPVPAHQPQFAARRLRVGQHPFQLPGRPGVKLPARHIRQLHREILRQGTVRFHQPQHPALRRFVHRVRRGRGGGGRRGRSRDRRHRLLGRRLYRRGPGRGGGGRGGRRAALTFGHRGRGCPQIQPGAQGPGRRHRQYRHHHAADCPGIPFHPPRPLSVPCTGQYGPAAGRLYAETPGFRPGVRF